MFDALGERLCFVLDLPGDLVRRGADQVLCRAVAVGPTAPFGLGALAWALEGHGILMRAEWDVERQRQAGRLVQVLPPFNTADADICALCPRAHHASPRVRGVVDFLAAAFARQGGDDRV